MNFKRILFLGAHPDDEFGCSGSLIRFIEEGMDVYFAVFSFCEESIPNGFSKDVLKGELDNSLKIIGIKPDNVFKYDFKVRRFPQFRQEILEELIVLKKQICPDVVLLPSVSDVHQDHHAISMEGRRAFKHNTILGYELPMNTIAFQHACFIRINEKQLSKKIESVRCYKSQHHRSYINEDFIRGLAKIRGVQSDESAAEAFEVIRLKI